MGWCSTDDDGEQRPRGAVHERARRPQQEQESIRSISKAAASTATLLRVWRQAALLPLRCCHRAGT
jgi:hypothetical protein